MREDLDLEKTRKLWKERLRTFNFPLYHSGMNTARNAASRKLDAHLKEMYGDNATAREDMSTRQLVINDVIVITP